MPKDKRIFGMTEQTWERHANPLSVWTRAATAPVLFVVVWSHTWLGWWSLLLVLFVAGWLIVNPRVFPKPRSTNNWGSKATFGERVWADRHKLKLPRHFLVLPWILVCVSGSGFVLGLVACWFNAFWPAFCGLCLTYLGKMWFLDRMVWLYELQASEDPHLRQWLY